MGWLCRDCLQNAPESPSSDDHSCPVCSSTRTLENPELETLAIAHIDCDAFYAAIEKRDNPELKDQPVLVGGGGGRGVVMTACYQARQFGCRSAMPMSRARKLCPDAVIVPPDMAKYQREGRRVRTLMLETTPLVQPLSVDEAFLDLSGTEKLHKGSPALTLARLCHRIEQEVGLTVSVGLSHNMFLAKIASNMNKPRGFTLIDRAETKSFLDPLPVGVLWGVGHILRQKLERDGFPEISDLRSCTEKFLTKRYGTIGSRLYWFSQGIDNRSVSPGGEMKSMSAETTFAGDIADREALRRRLWPLCEKVAARAKKSNIAGRVVTLKLKTADFRIRTRRRTLTDPTQLAEILWRTGCALLDKETGETRFRLIGIGLGDFCSGNLADPPDLADPDGGQIKTVENTMDALRSKFGNDAIGKGRSFSATSRTPSR
jgi:DNA polymerase-4